jgi:hypothetical protein
MSVDNAPTPAKESKNDKSKRSLEAFLNNPENEKLFKK